MEFNEHEESRLANKESLEEDGINCYPSKSPKGRLHTQKVLDEFETLEEDEKQVCIQGRIVLKRIMGGSSFAQIKDESGTIQIYLNRKRMGEETYNYFRYNTDLGDIVSIEGICFHTRTEEPTIKVDGWDFLSKSLTPLPDKHEGLEDTETRLRNRHLDLLANDGVQDTFRMRSKVFSFVRKYLERDDFVEVETPTLHQVYGGASAEPFTTHHNQLHQDLYLRIAPELYLKRLLVGGFERVFELGKVFRNEGVDRSHNPEFTSLELYQAYADYEDMMNLTQGLITSACVDLHSETDIEFDGNTIDLLGDSSGWDRIPLVDAIKERTGIDVMAFEGSNDALQEALQLAGLEGTEQATWAKTVDTLFSTYVEPHLIQPTFITDHPVEMSPLAKRHSEDDRLTERFELFIGGMEVANAFSELNDPLEQEQRFLDQGRQKDAGDDEAMQMDTDYLKALMAGMPPSGGLGIGMDRLVMLLTGNETIREVVLFPHLRSKA